MGLNREVGHIGPGYSPSAFAANAAAQSESIHPPGSSCSSPDIGPRLSRPEIRQGQIDFLRFVAYFSGHRQLFPPGLIYEGPRVPAAINAAEYG